MEMSRRRHFDPPQVKTQRQREERGEGGICASGRTCSPDQLGATAAVKAAASFTRCPEQLVVCRGNERPLQVKRGHEHFLPALIPPG